MNLIIYSRRPEAITAFVQLRKCTGKITGRKMSVTGKSFLKSRNRRRCRIKLRGISYFIGNVSIIYIIQVRLGIVVKLFIFFRSENLSKIGGFFCNGIKIRLETGQDILYTRNSRFSCKGFQRGFSSNLRIYLRKEAIRRSRVRRNVLSIHFQRSNIRSYR